jgi:hypothetical protein
MGIWRNIGKIVSLSCEIILLEMKWYIRSFKTSPTKKSNPLNEISRIERYNEEQESLERSKLMVELCEKPYYNIKPE